MEFIYVQTPKFQYALIRAVLAFRNGNVDAVVRNNSRERAGVHVHKAVAVRIDIEIRRLGGALNLEFAEKSSCLTADINSGVLQLSVVFYF